jgi:hypothetical protein
MKEFLFLKALNFSTSAQLFFSFSVSSLHLLLFLHRWIFMVEQIRVDSFSLFSSEIRKEWKKEVKWLLNCMKRSIKRYFFFHSKTVSNKYLKNNLYVAMLDSVYFYIFQFQVVLFLFLCRVWMKKIYKCKIWEKKENQKCQMYESKQSIWYKSTKMS